MCRLWSVLLKKLKGLYVLQHCLRIQGWSTGLDGDPENSYVCPRGICAHRGQPEACGRQCMKAQGDADAVYDEASVLRVLMGSQSSVL